MRFTRFFSTTFTFALALLALEARADFDVQVTGSLSGSVYGSGPYTNDSSLGAAAVHAGVLTPGQTGLIRVHELPGQSSYTGSTSNGVTSMSWGAWGASISLELLDSGGGGGGGGSGNHAPTVSFSAPSQVQTGQNVATSADAHDQDGDLNWITIRWLNHGVQADGQQSGYDGSISANSTAGSPGDTMYIRGEAADSHGAATASSWSAVSVNAPPSHPPVAYLGWPNSMTVNTGALFSVTGEDADGDLTTLYIECETAPNSGAGTVVLSWPASGGGPLYRADTITAPSTPQTQRFRAGAIDSAGHVYTSAWQPVVTYAAPPPVVNATPSSLSVGQLLTVSHANAPSGGMVRLYLLGDNTGAALMSAPVTSPGTGTVTFTLSSSFQVGSTYEARLYAANGTTLLAVSGGFTITAQPPPTSYEDVDVVGTTTGSAWGTDIYTSNSNLGVVAVHMGFLASGQAGRMRVYQLPGQSSYAASTRYGVTTNSYSSYPSSIRIEALPGGTQYPPAVRISLPSPAQAQINTTFLAFAQATDGNGDLRHAALSWDNTPLIDRSYSGAVYSDDLSVYVSAGNATGVKKIKVWAADSRDPNNTPGVDGYSSAELDVNVIPPNTAPHAVSVAATVASASSITFTGHATDAESNLSGFDFYVSSPPLYNGWYLQAHANVTGGDTTASATWSPSPAIAGGTYYVSLVARDGAGASSTETVQTAFFVPGSAAGLTADIAMPATEIRPSSGTLNHNIQFLGYSSNGTLTEYYYTITRGGVVQQQSGWTAFSSSTTSVWVEDGHWEDVDTGYWDQHWVSEGHYETVEDGHWEMVWDPRVINGTEFWWSQVWVVDSTHQEWVDTSHYEDVWVDTGTESQWVSDGGHYEDQEQIDQLTNGTANLTIPIINTTVLGDYVVALTVRNANGNTTAVSKTYTVTVNSLPPVAAAPSAQTANSFTANWGSVAGATAYRLDVSTSSTFATFIAGYQDRDVANVTSFNVTGLPANSTYYYRVRGINSGVASVNSNVITVLGVPSALPATTVTDTGFVANWSAVIGATGYRLDVSTSSTFATTVSGYGNLAVGNVTTFGVTGLTANTTYYFRVRASTAAGDSPNSNAVLVLGVPLAQSATALGSTDFTANWSGVGGATSYRLDVSTNPSFSSFVSGYQDRDVGVATSVAASGMPANTTLYYRVRSAVAGGFSANSNVITVLGAPLAQAATGITNGSFAASWTAIPGVTGYQLDASTSSTFASFIAGFQDRSVGNVLSLNVTGLASGVTYYYRVRAINAATTSGNSNVVAATLTGLLDTDNDGIPNAWEIAHGLDPNDPADAALDVPDGDGLSNVAEYNLGKDPHVYDAGTSTLGAPIGAGWPNQGDAAKTTTVGLTRGDLSVDKNGAATYSIPVWVVPGTAGMQPTLALNYSSQAGAGIAGFGWSVSGVSAIARGPQTAAVDNHISGVSFTYDDRFYLDGQRLIAVSGADGVAGTEYRTEIESFSRIVSYGAAGQGPAYFQVWTKSGLIMEYGNTATSAFNPGGRAEPLRWSVNKISDTVGNSIRFEYTEDTASGEQRIAAIRYTERTGGDYYASVVFDYEDRDDKATGYSAGAPLSTTKRLKCIRSCYGAGPGDGTTVRTYELSYVAEQDTSRSLLQKIEETGADGQKYPALTFAYETSMRGWSTANLAPPVSLAEDNKKPRGTGFIDLDGDGLPDFVQFHRWNADASEGGPQRGAWVQRNGAWVAADGSVTGVPNWQLPNGLADSYQPVLAWDEFADFGTRFIDLDHDGRVDILHAVKIGGTTYSSAYLNNGAGWTRAPQWDLPAGAYLASEGDQKGSSRLLDVNGDGRIDVVWNYDGSNKGCALNTGSGWELHSEWAPPIKVDGSVLFIDVNGDGLPDEIQHWFGGDSTVRGVALNTGAGWQALVENSTDFNRYVPPFPISVRSPNGGDYSPVGAEVVDLNGDGLVDLVWNNPAISMVGSWFNTGAGWVAAPAAYVPKFKLMDNNTAVGSALIDVNGDGIVDQVVSKETNPGNEAGVYLGTGRGWTDKLVSSPLALSYFVSRFDTAKSAGMDFVDLDGDGIVDQVWNLPGVSSGASRNASHGTCRLQSVTNGMDVTATITYAPLTERDAQGNPTVYDKGSGGPADTANVIGPMFVVKTVTHDDGAHGQYSIGYRYGGLRDHRLRGSLGFESMKVTDGRTNIVSTTTFKQVFPFTGMSYTNTTVSGTTSLSESIATYAEKTPLNTKVHLVFASDTLATTRDLNGAFINQTDTYIPAPATDVDDYGNIKQLVVDTLDGTGTPTGFKKTTVSTYANDDTHWFLGRLLKTAVTSTAPAKPNIVRTSGYLYDASTGLLTDEAVEPLFNGSGQLPALYTDLTGYGLDTLRTHYEYDAYGNKTAVRVSGLRVSVATDGTVTSANQLETRSTTTIYDALGRLPASMSNALGHTETYVEYDQALGVLKQLKGPNGLVTSWIYDGFGTKKQENRPDNTTTIINMKWAGSGAGVPTDAKYLIETESTGTAPKLAFYDSFGRVIRGLAVNGSGEMVYQDTHYDAMDRAYERSNPYRNDGQTVYWTKTLTYDLLNRPVTTQTPDDENGPVATGFVYNGLVTEATDAKNHVSQTTKNAQGWVISSIRNKNAGPGATDYAAVTFDHDALGNVLTTTASGVTTTLAYDLRGRKTQMDDADMGVWLYRYNAFGELIWQKDAKAQIVALSYDALGRLISRVEGEGTTNWSYDTAVHTGAPSGASPTWLGLLGSVSAPAGYAETQSYDTLGRPETLARTIDGTVYAMTQTYDSIGRPENTVYPTGFQVKNVYNGYGFLKEVRRADGGHNDVYWMADHYAVDGRVDGEFYGNGLVSDRVYSKATGRLTSANIDVGTVALAPYAVQQLVYHYDALGNVKSRTDAATGRDEHFSFADDTDGYDGLDRLRVHRIVGGATVTVDYDQQGNIISKSDVGSYSYNYTPSGRTAVLPHAVSSTTGATGNSYTYDANGNMLSGAGRTLQWTSFNQLLSATQGAYRSSFAFGAAHERVKQISHLGTTIYVGGLYEKVTNGSLVENKHYVMAPTGRIAVRIERSDGSIETSYFHSDGLGSITAVSDARGKIVKRFAFDAWGKRVDPGTNAAITSTTSGSYSRGFTDHEHLDDLGLIHMNGRVYDPVLGRFLSADPFVGSAGDSQSYNRYSYVGNNPLGATDPSGFFSLKDAAKIVAVVAIAWVTAGAALYAIGATSSLWGGMVMAATAHFGVGMAGLINAAVAGAGAGFASGFAGSLLNGGSVGDAFKAGVIGGLVGGVGGALTFGIGNINGDLGYWGTAAAHGAVQGGLNEAVGGDFRHGFYAGFAAAAAGAPIERIPGTSVAAIAERVAAAAVVGGTASALGGGKFANGAVSGAFVRLFNEEAHQSQLGDVRLKQAGIRVNPMGFGPEFDSRQEATLNFVGTLEHPLSPFSFVSTPYGPGAPSFENAFEVADSLNTMYGIATTSPSNVEGGDYTNLAKTYLSNLKTIFGTGRPWEAYTVVQMEKYQEVRHWMFFKSAQWVPQAPVYTPVRGPLAGGLFFGPNDAASAATHQLATQLKSGKY